MSSDNANIVKLAKSNPFSSPFLAEESERKFAFAAAAAPANPGEVPYGSLEYYAKCAIGGALSCGLTHTAVVPLDLVKCRIQVDPAKYKGIVAGFRVSVAEEGARGLAKGWAPTLIGYSIQGLGKFGFYELFKSIYADALGEVIKFFYLFYDLKRERVVIVISIFNF
jgi:solute carrier family 25 (mitochondrial phosphate transporter), member 3